MPCNDTSRPRMSLGAMTRAVTSIPLELQRAVPLSIALCDQGAMLLQGRHAATEKANAHVARCVSAIDQANKNEEAVRERLESKHSKFEVRVAVANDERSEVMRYEADARNKKSIEVRRRKLLEVKELHRSASTKKEHEEPRISHSATASPEHEASRKAVAAMSSKDWHEHLVRSCVLRNERSSSAPYLRSELERSSKLMNNGKLTDIATGLRLAEERYLRGTPELSGFKSQRQISCEPIAGSASFDERCLSFQTKSKKSEAKLSSFKAEDEAYRQEIASVRKKKFDSVLQRSTELRATDQRNIERNVRVKSSPSMTSHGDQSRLPTFNGSHVWARVKTHIDRAKHIEQKRTEQLEHRSVEAGMKYVENRLLSSVL